MNIWRNLLHSNVRERFKFFEKITWQQTVLINLDETHRYTWRVTWNKRSFSLKVQTQNAVV